MNTDQAKPQNQSEMVSFIWSIADDILRDALSRGKYRDIILPFVVLRRIDAILEDTKAKVLENYKFLVEADIDNYESLTSSSGYPFYNISPFTFKTLLASPQNIYANLNTYLDGFSNNIKEVISKFKLKAQLETLNEHGLIVSLIERFCSNRINLSPVAVNNDKGEPVEGLDNIGMGYVFEELIRRFNEENNEEAGEHFTPREVIELMGKLVFTPIKDLLAKTNYSLYDPACGSGGMLTESEQIAKQFCPTADFDLYGQEINPETWAICTSDLLIKGKKTDGIQYGSTLSNDNNKIGRNKLAGKKFDFMFSNPPYGKSWQTDKNNLVSEAEKGKFVATDPRFRWGLPAVSDGQLLFLCDMVSRFNDHPNNKIGSHIASVHNGSALFSGDAGSGESDIRKYIVDNDLLSAIIALPKNIFYNTGIPTYIWLLNNQKPAERKGKVQLINALGSYTKLRKNLGQKNCELSANDIQQILDCYLQMQQNDISQIYPNYFFRYYKITIERPLRWSARFSPEAIQQLRFSPAFRLPMAWLYERLGESVYNETEGLFQHSQPNLREELTAYTKAQGLKLEDEDYKRILNPKEWLKYRPLLQAA